ncbi:MAG TPA: glycosyltransferase family 4 protein [Burkholderiaceae bacterium]|nr:glycosyltransferase family 4 protein [Burkholderiaceae bacterium]
MKKHKKHIVMLGTSFHTMGGISAVVNEYRRAALFDRFPVIYLATHADGGKLTKLRFLATSWLAYVRLLLGRKVALTHVHVASNFSFWRKSLFLVPTILFRVPSLLHLHGGGFSGFYENGCNDFGRYLIRYVFDRADGIIVLSDAWQRWVRNISRNARIVPINNPVRLPPDVDFAQREPATILFLGRLGKRKGTYDLLAAVAGLTGRYPNLKLLLGGDGKLERVKEEAESLGIGSHVEILGWVSGEDKSELLKRASIYVLPSYAEGLPMSVLEAMACGLPIVSTPVGGIPEVVTDGVEGYLVPPGDVAALVGALDRLLSDGDLRRRMGEAARHRAENTFSVERVLPQLESLYRELGVEP